MAINISRRKFVGGAAVVTGAAAVAPLVNVATAGAAPTLPVSIPDASIKTGWVALDAAALARQGYEIYRGRRGSAQSACCEATYWPVIGALAVNFPNSAYAAFPKGLMNYGGGGVNAWRSICGGPNGGTAMLKQIGAPSNLMDQFMRWYESNQFPSNAAYVDYASGAWNPATDGSTATGGWTSTAGATTTLLLAPMDNAPRAIPQGNLCHSSHGRWIEAAGGYNGAWAVLVGQQGTASDRLSQAGADRCAKLVYDCVYYLATAINAWAAGGFSSTYGNATLDPSATSAGCMKSTCHSGMTTAARPVLGKSKCTDMCH